MSLGVDPLSASEKVCNFDCIYCQIGKTQRRESERKIFVPTQAIIEEIKTLKDVKIDYITFSARGETTLAKNLGELIREVRKIRKEKIAVITNAALLHLADVVEDLSLADVVFAKMDACSEQTFKAINWPAGTVKFQDIVSGIKNFRNVYKGKLALQIMFVDQNKYHVREIAKAARDISPDEVQINTPLRPCDAPPLSKEILDELKKEFEGLPVISVYDVEKKEFAPLDDKGTRLRHGEFERKKP